MTSVDNVFRDTSGQAYNEFMPVSLVLRPYVQELEAAADAHIKREPSDGVTISNGESVCEQLQLRSTVAFCAKHASHLVSTGIGKPGTSGRCNSTSLEEGRASSGQSATEPLGQHASAFCQG